MGFGSTQDLKEDISKLIIQRRATLASTGILDTDEYLKDIAIYVKSNLDSAYQLSDDELIGYIWTCMDELG